MGLKKTSWWLIIAILLSLIIGIFIGFFISGKSFHRSFFMTSKNKIEVILDIINEDYVDPVSTIDLTEEAIPKIINELDPHSLYIPQRELQTINEDMDGHFAGIGAEILLHRDTIIIVSVTQGGPAEQAGILPGDRIVTVNDSLFVGSSISEDETYNKLRGPLDSILKLGISRHPSEDILQYSIKRGSIPLTTVRASYEVEKGIGLIKIYDKFSHSTYDEFVNALAKLLAAGCESFIIDLRTNGGGALEAAILIANEFLPRGQLIVYTEGKAFPRDEVYADGSGTCLENQVVILMDQLSASASEIIAAAIQDNDRGLIIGRRSFGKGLVQNQIELSDGSALRLTIARYYSPSGRNIQRKYELGKSDEYNQEWLDQLTNGEGFHQDSIKLDKTQEYKTLNGRTVYANGGIMPDIFIPIDTVKLTSYFINLENKDIFNRFAFNYADNNRAELKQFKTDTDMLNHLKSEPILHEIVRYAEEQGIRRRSNLIYKSSNQILTTTYAYILRNFFGDESFYPIYLENDPDIKKAVEVIQKRHAEPKAVAKMTYNKK